MFCSKCGAKNEDNATFCVSCGNKFTTPAIQGAPQTSSQPIQLGQKNATVAAILNFLFPGIGYWYWGFQKVATIPPVLLFIAVIVVEYTLWYFLFYAGIIVLAINVFFAYDLWVKTTGQKGWIEATR